MTLYVVRSQGVEGHVTVEWRTKELTAKSNNKIPPDFVVSRNTSEYLGLVSQRVLDFLQVLLSKVLYED